MNRTALVAVLVVAAVGTVVLLNRSDYNETVTPAPTTASLGTTVAPAAPTTASLGTTVAPAAPTTASLGTTVAPAAPTTASLGTTVAPAAPTTASPAPTTAPPDTTVAPPAQPESTATTESLPIQPEFEPLTTSCSSPDVVDQALEGLVEDCEALLAFYLLVDAQQQFYSDSATAWSATNALENWKVGIPPNRGDIV